MRNRIIIRRLVISLVILVTAAAIVFLSVFLLAKQKKIFINRWFVDEKNSTVGVDVSSYQEDIDMGVLKEQDIRFVYIKATEGSGSQDPRFAENWKNAEKAGLLSGAYHFFSFDSAGRTQAENFIRTAGPDMKGRLLPAVDVEYYGDKEQNPPEKEDVVRELKVYLETLEKEYGVKPLIYTGADIYEKYLKGEFDGYKKWMSSLFTPLRWNYKDEWVIWQYLNRGELEGYSGGERYIDLNVLSRGTELEELTVK